MGLRLSLSGETAHNHRMQQVTRAVPAALTLMDTHTPNTQGHLKKDSKLTTQRGRTLEQLMLPAHPCNRGPSRHGTPHTAMGQRHKTSAIHHPASTTSQPAKGYHIHLPTYRRQLGRMDSPHMQMGDGSPILASHRGSSNHSLCSSHLPTTQAASLVQQPIQQLAGTQLHMRLHPVLFLRSLRCRACRHTSRSSPSRSQRPLWLRCHNLRPQQTRKVW